MSIPSIVVRTVTDPAAWDDYVARHPHATAYHQRAWLGVIERSFGHRALALGAYAGERLVGLFPIVAMRSWLFGRFLVSLPFVNYGGLLADDAEVERRLWEAGVEEAKRAGARHLEARHFVRRTFVEHRRQHKVTMILDLEDGEETQWKAFDAKLRNQIRKAQRSGLTAAIGGIEELRSFYDVFAVCMRDLGTPVYDRRFFREVLEAFPEAARVLLVRKDDVTVAAGIALEHRDTLEVPWAGSLREYRPSCPNNLLYWEAIRLCFSRGLRRFDFGRSTPGDGPYRFKEQWGAKAVPLHWEYWLREGAALPDLSPRSGRFEAATRIWSRLPVTLTRWIGPPIVRGIP